MTKVLHHSDVDHLGDEDLRRLQFSKLRQQLVRVYEQSPYYRQKFKAAGVNPHRLRGWDDYANYPFFDKEEERISQERSRDELRHPFGMHVTCEVSAINRISASSGTTGTPTYIGYTARDRAVSEEHFARMAARMGLAQGDRALFAGVMSMWVVGIPSVDAMLNLGFCVIPIGGLAKTERFAQTAIDTRPDFIMCTPSYGLHLIKAVPEKTRWRTQDFGIRKMLVFGEPGGSIPEIRQRLSEGFGGAEVYDMSGGTGCNNPLGVSCEAHNGIHIFSSDNALMEVLDSDLMPQPLENGVEGEVVFTGLVKECQPLVRWRDKDLIRVYTDPCPCGRPGPRIEFLGRIDDMLLVKGVNVFPNAVRDVVARSSDLVSGDIQIIRHSPSAVVEAPVEVQVCLKPDVADEPRESLKLRLEEILQNTLRFRARVKLIDPEGFTLEYGSTGKAKLVRTLSTSKPVV
ncbi:phenylacetate--CoA ligase family protein [Kineobactrum salinum]|uniref:Phenylacetate--CoA ligase n=1 Tax=Kineobactrum salinum TaxID=2708301 RepID=A0A6C0TZ60_9GAMM|nr:phenylacetate--CoA ligase [Kineobactrum salinum]QIB65100.1 phenylacetate--CoA ligase [Kineobactrum salinum]